MYKIDRNLLPEYITNIFAKKRTKTSFYNIKNSENYSFPKCRLQLYKCAFYSTGTLFLCTHIQVTPFVLTANIACNNCDTIAHKSTPEFYPFGDRYSIIIQTQLRHNCALNSDQFRHN